MPYEYRELRPDDAPFLLEMLRYALGWRLVPPADGSPLPVAVPPHALHDLGRPGDGGVVATYDGEHAGACWLRLPAAGERVPELTIAVLPQHRARGVGGRLLDRCLEQARAAGHDAIELLVERDNPARGMYERRGFEAVGDPLDGRRMRRSLR